MTTATLERTELAEESPYTADDPFDLDITVIEVGEAADTMIQMTDDNCGSSCPNACTTSVA